MPDLHDVGVAQGGRDGGLHNGLRMVEERKHWGNRK